VEDQGQRGGTGKGLELQEEKSNWKETAARRRGRAKTEAPASRQSAAWSVFVNPATPVSCARSRSTCVGRIPVRTVGSALARRAASPGSAAAARRRSTADCVSRRRTRASRGHARREVAVFLTPVGRRVSVVDVDVGELDPVVSRRLPVRHWRVASSTAADGCVSMVVHALPRGQSRAATVRSATWDVAASCEPRIVTRLRVRTPVRV